VPYQPAALYRAIPAQASYLSLHKNLAGRWDMLVTHPLLRGMAESMGVPLADIEEVARDPEFRRLLNELGSDRVLVGYVPHLRSSDQPAWVFSTWLGGHSQRARWMLKSLSTPHLNRAATRNGWLVWVWTPPELKGQRLVFALVEGMLVGCLAGESGVIDDVLAGVDGNLSTMADRPWLQIEDSPESVERGWFRTEAGALFPFTMELQTNGGLAGSLHTPWQMPGLARETGAVAGARGFANLIGDRAVAALALDRELLRAWLGRAFTNALTREVTGLLERQGEGPVAMALLGGEYSGRFMAVRLPTLLAGVAGPPAAQMRHVQSALDRLNALTRWGLILAPIAAGSSSAYAIESTGQSVYAMLAPEERMAYTPTADGLVFASNRATLERLLRERDETTAPASSRMEQGWARMAEDAARGFLWFDAAEGAKVIRLGITAWSLKLLLEDAEGSLALRQHMNDIKAWADAVAPLGQIWIGLEDREGNAYFTLQAGAK